jgi:hypothetical protein
MADTFRAPLMRNDIGGPVKPLPVTHAIAIGFGITTLLENRLVGAGRETGVTGDAIVIDEQRHISFPWGENIG